MAASSFQIVGTIATAAGTPVAGARVRLRGSLFRSTTTAIDGTFGFANLPAGNYTVTPSKSGYAFNPTQLSYRPLSANQTANFVAVPATPLPATYSISGSISPASASAGTAVSLGGAASATVSPDSSGAFTFAGLANGTYVVTPANNGVSFTPSSRTITVNGANVALPAFTAAQVFTVAGTVTPQASGSGTTISLTQGTITIATATADTSGAYSFPGIVGGTYSLTPARAGFTFAPATATISVTTSGVTAPPFVATAVPVPTDPARPQPIGLNTASLQYQHLAAAFPLWITSSTENAMDFVHGLFGTPSQIAVQSDPVMGNVFASTGHSHYTVPYDASVDFASPGDTARPFSISVWVKVTIPSSALSNNDNPKNMYVVSFDANTIQYAWPGYGFGAAATLADNGPITTELDVDGHQAQQTMFGNSVINDGKWHLIVATYTPSASTMLPTSTAHIYIDGVLDSTNTAMAEMESPLIVPPSQLVSPLAMFIGVDDDGASNPWQGMFCDLRFYDTALTPAAIAAMYAPATRWELYR